MVLNPSPSAAPVHRFGAPVMGIGLWGLSPLCEIGISRRSVYQMTTPREQARGEGNCRRVSDRQSAQTKVPLRNLFRNAEPISATQKSKIIRTILKSPLARLTTTYSYTSLRIGFPARVSERVDSRCALVFIQTLLRSPRLCPVLLPRKRPICGPSV